MKTNRRGFALLELAVAGGLLATLMVVCLQLLTASAAQRRIADQRQLAVLEVENVMERLAARPWSELTQTTAARQRLSPSISRRLSGEELKIEVSDSPTDPNVKRIAVSIAWPPTAARPLSPVKIVTWRYRGAGDEGRGAGDQK